MKPTTAAELRRAFLDFFAARDHKIVPSEGLIPSHPAAPLLTGAGMMQFIPIIMGEEPPSARRIADVQKCFRTVDIDIIGTTTRHCTFFEMLGNWSFGDYWKDGAIRLAWELVTTVFEFDPERVWVTVHETDDEAEQIWRDEIGVAPERIQRMGDDNFWDMGPTGPCGPSSELYLDRGPEHGAEGGPASGGPERYVEFWNLVFMQYNKTADGALHPLAMKTVDTGAGFERLLALLNDTPSVFETDVMRALVAVGERVSGRVYGADERDDISLRILADHGRAMTFLVGDSVFPSNEGRGYVLRRVIRRAVRHAFRLGVETVITEPLVRATVELMGDAYPDTAKQRDYIIEVTGREEARFRETLRRGIDLLDDLLARGDVSGDDAYHLHDTLGFPIDVTREIAEERGRRVDVDGFNARMREQRERARAAQKASGATTTSVEIWRTVLDTSGPTEFTGYQETETDGARVVTIVRGGGQVERAEAGAIIEVVLDRTPFYAEAGGQIGDRGTIDAPTGRLTVTDTVYGLPGTLTVHRATVDEGEISRGALVVARVDPERRERTRRNHTATHLLHWALREVVGGHVKQAGSLVAPDRLRFDFSHYEAVTPAELAQVEALANREVLRNAAVRAYETTKDHADTMGAIAFFGDKYGEVVRVVHAGDHSLELCGGTHVHVLGQIGPIKILREESIGSNLRRIEALTGEGALEHFRAEEELLRTSADLLRVTPPEIPDRVEKLLAQVRALQDELEATRARQAAGEATSLATQAVDGIVAVRRDGETVDGLRRLAIAVRDELPSGVVIVGGAAPDGAKAGVAVAVTNDLVARGVQAGAIVAGAAKQLGGGAPKSPDVAAGGGSRVEAIDAALENAHAAAAEALRGAA